MGWGDRPNVCHWQADALSPLTVAPESRTNRKSKCCNQANTLIIEGNIPGPRVNDATATFRIWRGEKGQGKFRDYTAEVSAGMVVLDAVHIPKTADHMTKGVASQSVGTFRVGRRWLVSRWARSYSWPTPLLVLRRPSASPVWPIAFFTRVVS